jgi:heptosyltransferase II
VEGTEEFSARCASQNGDATRAAASLMSRERILVRSVNWLGDAIMTTPALARLREARPEAHITLLTPQKLAELWQHHPALDEVISIDRSDTLLCVAKRIRRGRFDVALLFPNSPRAALEPFLARVPERIAFARPWRTWALTKPVPCPGQKATTTRRSTAEVQRLIREQPEKGRDIFPTTAHQVHDYLRLVQTLGADPTPLAPAISITEQEVKTVRRQFRVDEGDLLLGLNPGAEYGPAKRWPENSFIEAARRITTDTKCRWWIFGGPGDVAVAERIAGGIGDGSAQSLAGQTSLRELCAALKACSVVLTNDTGPMHVAAAVGTPVVVPFGSTSPELTGPGWPVGYGHRLLHGKAPCAPCFRRTCPIDFRCMTSIAVNDVARAVLELVASRRAHI